MEHFTNEDDNLFEDVRKILATKKEEFSLMEVVMTFSRTQFVERRLLGRDSLLERMEWLIVTVMKDGSDLMEDVTTSFTKIKFCKKILTKNMKRTQKVKSCQKSFWRELTLLESEM